MDQIGQCPGEVLMVIQRNSVKASMPASRTAMARQSDLSEGMISPPICVVRAAASRSIFINNVSCYVSMDKLKRFNDSLTAWPAVLPLKQPEMTRLGGSGRPRRHRGFRRAIYENRPVLLPLLGFAALLYPADAGSQIVRDIVVQQHSGSPKRGRAGTRTGVRAISVYGL